MIQKELIPIFVYFGLMASFGVIYSLYEIAYKIYRYQKQRWIIYNFVKSIFED